MKLSIGKILLIATVVPLCAGEPNPLPVLPPLCDYVEVLEEVLGSDFVGNCVIENQELFDKARAKIRKALKLAKEGNLIAALKRVKHAHKFLIKIPDADVCVDDDENMTDPFGLANYLAEYGTALTLMEPTVEWLENNPNIDPWVVRRVKQLDYKAWNLNMASFAYDEATEFFLRAIRVTVRHGLGAHLVQGCPE